MGCFQSSWRHPGIHCYLCCCLQLLVKQGEDGEEEAGGDKDCELSLPSPSHGEHPAKANFLYFDLICSGFYAARRHICATETQLMVVTLVFKALRNIGRKNHITSDDKCCIIIGNAFHCSWMLNGPVEQIPKD